MNRAEFKAISHEYRELNFKAHSSSHICTARNCSCRDEHLYRHTGWQWRIAQQHGEAMATRIARMFGTRKTTHSMRSHRLEQRIENYWHQKNRQSVLNVAKARCIELFGSQAA